MFLTKTYDYDKIVVRDLSKKIELYVVYQKYQDVTAGIKTKGVKWGWQSFISVCMLCCNKRQSL